MKRKKYRRALPGARRRSFERRPVKRATITKRRVDALQEGESLVDDKVRGFVVRRLKKRLKTGGITSGSITYGLRYSIDGKQKWLSLGLHGRITPDQARELAQQRAGEVAAGRNPLAEIEAARAKASGSNTIDALLDAFVERHVRKNLRSADEIERVFNVYVRPRIGWRPIHELQRRDVVELLDAIEDSGAPVMADRTLAHLRKAFNWWATRDDTFVPPIVKGMARTKPAERARKRFLSDEELCDVWRALDVANVPTCYPAYVRALLLTAQRRDEVARMNWPEIEGNVWVIPAERYKSGNENIVPVTEAITKLLGKPQKLGFVFSTTGGELPFSGFSKSKRALDKAIAELRKGEKRKPMPHWTLHDLRRTARSLMSRAGVAADIAERVLGHKIAGVRGVYDRYEYLAEKRDALERLVAQLERILTPTTSNVVPLARTAERA
jgi:integrase